MANNPNTIPGLSREVASFRRPTTTGVYFSSSQQEWTNLCRQTLSTDADTKRKAIDTLKKKDKAGRTHETPAGELAQIRCTECKKGGNGDGHPCCLPANSTTRTCAHCQYTHKSGCNARRAPPGSNTAAAGAAAPTVHQPTAHQPVVAGPSGPTHSSTPTRASVPPQSVASRSTHPHLPVQRQNQGYTQPATSGSSNNRSNVPIDPILLQLDRLPDMTEEEMAAWVASCESTRNRILRRYHGHGQGDDQGQL